MYTTYDMYFKTILDTSSIQRKFCFKPTPDITYTWNKVLYYKYLKKHTTKFKYKNTIPGEQKGEVIVYSVQQPLNLILYKSKLRSI